MRRPPIAFILPLVLFGSGISGVSAIDENGNGLNDIWETGYGQNLPVNLDPDGDGATTGEEEQAGTNPTDPKCRFTVAKVRMSEDELQLEWTSVAGKWYSVEVNPNLDDPNGWVEVGPGYLGTGENMTASFTDDVNTLVPGGVTRKWWEYEGWDQIQMAEVRASALHPHPADVTDTRNAIQAPSGSSPNYFGQYMEGWIIPSQTDSYYLYISSNDWSELWFSTTPGSPLTSRVAYVNDWNNALVWTNYATQRSVAVNLEAGKPYRFQVYHENSWSTHHLAVGWKLTSQSNSTIQVIGAANIATGYPSLKDYGITLGEGLYARVKVRDHDTDGDGLSDYEEAMLGLNHAKAETTARIADMGVAMEKLESDNTLTAGASALRAYEAGQQPGVFTIFRSGNVDPLEFSYTISGTATSGADFAPLTGTATIPLGATKVDIPLIPVSDGLLEPAETVVLELTPNASYTLGNPVRTTITIDDAADQLFIAPLRSFEGLGSPASGFAAINMAGNRAFGVLSMSFTNLASPQTQAQLYITESGQPDRVVLTLTPGQLAQLNWLFEPAGGASTQQITDALVQGRMYVRLGTEEHPGGEAGGQFLANEGWQTMPTPPDPPAYTPGLTDAEAARFLIQATFGPTEADINELKAMGYTAWLDEQINTLPATLHLPYVQARRQEHLAETGDIDNTWQRPRQEAWWEAAVRGEDQLRQRMALALSEIFVVSDIGVLDGSHEGITNWYDMLVENAFGNYRELLEKVTLSPIMGQYLSMALNRKADPTRGTEPDENYAREIQQLFSIGLYQLNPDGSAQLDAVGLPIPTYTQADIISFARVFTGWGFAGNDPEDYYKPYPINQFTEMLPMVQYPRYHDRAAKTLHNGVTIPENTSGEAELEIAMDNLANHPNAGPFIARQLIQRFVTSNPSPGYIYRVAQVFDDNGSGVRGDLGAVIRAVLMDYEARSPDLIPQQSFGKLKEPLLRMSHLFRAAGAYAPVPGDNRLFLGLEYSMNQSALKSPSVFNFFQPGYIPPGRMAFNGLFAPEFQIFAESSAVGQINVQDSALDWGIWTVEPLTSTSNYSTRVDLTGELAKILEVYNTAPGDYPWNATPPYDYTAYIDYLDKVYLAGQMSANLRAKLTEYFGILVAPPHSHRLTSTSTRRSHAAFGVYIVLASPEFTIQK